MEPRVDRPAVHCPNQACEINHRAQFMTRDGRCRVCGTPLPEGKPWEQAQVKRVRRIKQLPKPGLATALGAAIRLAREALGITQEVLAQRAGIRRTLLSKYENGRVEIGVRRFLKVCLGLNIPPDVLLQWIAY